MILILKYFQRLKFTSVWSFSLWKEIALPWQVLGLLVNIDSLFSCLQDFKVKVLSDPRGELSCIIVQVYFILSKTVSDSHLPELELLEGLPLVYANVNSTKRNRFVYNMFIITIFNVYFCSVEPDHNKLLNL